MQPDLNQQLPIIPFPEAPKESLQSGVLFSLADERLR